MNQASQAAHPCIAAIVLAAGRSRRMPGGNKLLAPVGGRPMVLRVVEAALASRATVVLAVLGYQWETVRAVLAGRPVAIIVHDGHDGGLASSVRAGVLAAPADADGYLFLLGDVPLVRADHIDRLIDAFDPGAGRAVYVPVHAGRRGNPVLWAAAYRHDLCALTGDTGARPLLQRYADEVCEVPMPDDAVLLDADTAADLARLNGEQSNIGSRGIT